jgi:acetylornithine aminotransferase
MGRTGTWFGFETEKIRPDIITLAKGLGGGLPMGAMIALKTAPSFSPGEHGSTFGANPIVAAAANAVIDTIEDQRLMDRAVELERLFKERLNTIEGVKSVRGRGLLLGIVLKEPRAKEVVSALQARSILANATSDEVVRIGPPLIITKKDVSTFIARFSEVMAEL